MGIRHLNIYACTVLSGFLAVSGLRAQQVDVDTIVYTTIHLDMLGVADGLSQGMINDVVEDQEGYLWIATKEGLNRYDGAGVKVFRHNPNDSLSLSGNLVTSLLVDEMNRLWVGTQSNGVNLFNRQSETFTHFRKDLPNPKSIPSDFISRLFLTPDGAVGVMSRAVEDVCLIYSESGAANDPEFSVIDFCALYPVLAVNGHCKNGSPHTLNDNNKNRTGFSKDGSFWFFNGEDSLTWYSRQALIEAENPVVFHVEKSKVTTDKSVLKTLVFNQDRSEVFLTDGQQRLLKFNNTSKSLEPFIELPELISFSGRIFVDADEQVFADLDGDRLMKICPSKGEVEIAEYIGWGGQLKLSKPMIRDSYGNLWLPTNGYGLAKISARQEMFNRLPNSGVSFFNFWLLRVDRPGSRTTYDHRVVEQVLDEREAIIQSFAEQLFEAMSTHLTVDGSGNLIMSTGPELNNSIHCIKSVNLKTGHFQNVYCEPFTNDPLHSLIPLMFDNNGDLWFCCSYDNREVILYHLAQENSVPSKYPLPINPGPLHYRFISDWHQDDNGTWWFATVKGLFSFNKENETWKHYHNIEGDLSSLSFDVTLSICPDPREPERYLWIGTEGRGLNKFDRKEETFVHYTTEDGLPNDVIYGIQSDEHKNLWLSTNRGLCLFNPVTKNVRNFTAADGLNGNEFNRYQYSKAADGTMYFGGVEGTTWFHPDDFYRDTTASGVVINGLKIVNKPIEFHHQPTSKEVNYSLAAPMEYTRLLEFNHDVGMISLTFTMLDFTVPEQHQFRYKLVGLDKEWIEAGNAREATYTNLSPGDYTFQVMGLNSNHVWSKPTELAITILPPWWATWWFRTLFALAIFGLLYALYRYRLAQVVRLERMRNRIAQDLHDEIGSTLSSISLYSAVIQKSANGMPEKSKAVLDKISTSTSEMMESMNDIVWTIKADNDHFEHVVNRMRAFAVNMTEARGISLDFNVEGNVRKLHLNMVARKNLYLIFKEAVNNSVKYANADTIYVVISYQQDRLEMEISDNGCGFKLESVEQRRDLSGGNGLRGMKSRAEEIKAQFEMDSQPNRGTAIKVSFAIR